MDTNSIISNVANPESLFVVDQEQAEDLCRILASDLGWQIKPQEAKSLGNEMLALFNSLAGDHRVILGAPGDEMGSQMG